MEEYQTIEESEEDIKSLPNGKWFKNDKKVSRSGNALIRKRGTESKQVE